MPSKGNRQQRRDIKDEFANRPEYRDGELKWDHGELYFRAKGGKDWVLIEEATKFPVSAGGNKPPMPKIGGNRPQTYVNVQRSQRGDFSQSTAPR